MTQDSVEHHFDLEFHDRVIRASKFVQSHLDRAEAIRKINNGGAKVMQNELMRRVMSGVNEVDDLMDYSLPVWEHVSSSIDSTDYLNQHLKGKVLDVGSGANSDLLKLPDQSRVTYFDKQYLPSHPNAVRGDAEKMEFPDQSFDSVHAGNFIQPGEGDRSHYKRILDQIKRVIKPGGTLVINSEPTEVAEILAFLEEEGIDYNSVVELTLAETTKRHKDLNVEQTLLSSYISVKL